MTGVRAPVPHRIGRRSVARCGTASVAGTAPSRSTGIPAAIAGN